ncbi:MULTISPECIES: hypothetical protein [unclassified Streptomyces]|uniref:hypothetical protein n=1 Tax=unclassified Streptomyces TaxID=2593676 RepID=UPI00030640AE|nr:MULTISPECIES: hypothetical protein [unclassified Streptomyces]
MGAGHGPSGAQRGEQFARVVLVGGQQQDAGVGAQGRHRLVGLEAVAEDDTGGGDAALEARAADAGGGAVPGVLAGEDDGDVRTAEDGVEGDRRAAEFAQGGGGALSAPGVRAKKRAAAQGRWASRAATPSARGSRAMTRARRAGRIGVWTR